MLITSYGIEIKRDCPHSSLWFYSLLSVLFHTTSFSFANVASTPASRSDRAGLEYSLCCLCIIEFGMTIWGGIEIFQFSCPSLHHSNLYIFGYVSFIKQLSTLFFLVVFPCLVFAITPSPARQPSQSPTEAYSYHLFLSRTPVKHVQFPEDLPDPRRRSAEQFGSVGEEETKVASSASPSPNQHGSQQGPLDNQPMVLSDSEGESDDEEKGQSVLSQNTNTSII